jgi:hypothetical protein
MYLNYKLKETLKNGGKLVKYHYLKIVYPEHRCNSMSTTYDSLIYAIYVYIVFEPLLKRDTCATKIL